MRLPWCCNNRRKVCCSLILISSIALFTLNLISQFANIPPQTKEKWAKDSDQIRYDIIDSWRKEKSEKSRQPIISPVQCQGQKCAKYLSVLGLDGESNSGTDSKNCKHPVLSMENDTIKHAFDKLPPVNCSASRSMKSFYREGKIYVDEEETCLLEALVRPERDDNSVRYENATLIKTTQDLPNDYKSDFFLLTCLPNYKLSSADDEKKISEIKSASDKQSQQIFTHIYKYPEGKPEIICSADKCLPYNVLILGVGSLSQMSFRRLLPKTFDFFTNALKSVTLGGYNVVGHGSSSALLPILTGLDEDSVPEARRNKENSHFVDKLQLLWNEFDSSGYVTLYAEDHAKRNTFNEKFHGFEITPTTHYMRPFWLAAESLAQSHEVCLGDSPKHTYILDYLKSFNKVYADHRRFAVVLLKELTDHNVNHAQHLDDDLLAFLKSMSQHLENTFIFLMSDYGVLPEKSLASWQAKIESRMPLMSIHMPSTFLSDYKDLAHNLVINEDRLTTPYDIYMTLKDLLDKRRFVHDDPREQKLYGQSLFKAIPLARTCESAGVDIHWCACVSQFHVDPNQIDAAKIEELFLNKLNEKTSEYRDDCSPYTRIEVLNATRLVPYEQVKQYETETNEKFSPLTQLDLNFYQMTARLFTKTIPYESHIYEATFKFTNQVLPMFGGYELASDIIRINTIPVHSCLQKARELIKYCSCLK